MVKDSKSMEGTVLGNGMNEKKHQSPNIIQTAFLTNLREFVKTHVILAPLREFSRSRAASKIPFPGAQPGKAG